MADITRRIAAKAAPYLEPGEQVRVVLLAEPAGTLGIGSAAVATLPALSTKVLADRAASAYALAGGMAAGLPARSFVAVATDRRILVAPSSGIGMAEPAAAYPLGAMAVEVAATKLLGRRLRLAFSDGTEAFVDVQRGQPVDAFARAVGGAA